MSETVTFSPDVAEDLIVPVCVGMGWRAAAHEHDGFTPHSSNNNWFTIQRKSDDKVFVAYFITDEEHAALEDKWETEEDSSPFVDGFGAVKRFNHEADEYEYFVKVDEIVFTAVTTEKVADPEFGGMKDIYRLADGTILGDDEDGWS